MLRIQVPKKIKHPLAGQPSPPLSMTQQHHYKETKDLSVKYFWPYMRTTRGRCLPNLFLWHDLRNFKEEKHLSSSTEPKTRTQPILANIRYSGISFDKCRDAERVLHNLISGFTPKGGAQAASQLAFMLTLKRPCCVSNFEAFSISGAQKAFPPSTNGFPSFTTREPQQKSFKTCKCFWKLSSAPSCNQY